MNKKKGECKRIRTLMRINHSCLLFGSTHAMVIIILQYISVSNQQVVHLKLTQYYMSIISQKSWGKKINISLKYHITKGSYSLDSKRPGTHLVKTHHLNAN